MRKYFLLSVAALMISGTANATTDYAEVTAKATIEVASQISCGNIDFGTIVVKQGNEAFDIDLNGDVVDDEAGDVIKSPGRVASATCHIATGNIVSYEVPGSVTLYGKKSNNSKTLAVSLGIQEGGDGVSIYDLVIEPDLTVPADIVSDEYEGAFTLTVTY